MRLFKFLVITDEVMRNCGVPVTRTNTAGRILNTKNEFFNYRYDLNLSDPKNIVFMSIEYPNEGKDFGNINRAYAIINENDIEEVMKLISPTSPTKRIGKIDKVSEKVKEVDDNFQGCRIKDCDYCMESCRSKIVSLTIPSNKRYIRGKTWSFANDVAGKKYEIPENKRNADDHKTMEPKTGGIAYSSIQWVKDRDLNISDRPKNLGKTVSVPLHHWIKCNSIPINAIKKKNMTRKENEKEKDKYSFYHVGHIFDYRKEFIGLATRRDQEKLRKVTEPQNDIRRGRRVLAGQTFFSRTLQCNCGSENYQKCRDCAGVLYIETDY